MKSYIRSNNLQITQNEDVIFIKDKMKLHKIIQIISGIFWMVFSFIGLYNKNFDLKIGWVYYLLILVWIIVLVLYVRIDVSSQIRKENISLIKIRKTIFGDSGVSIIHNNKKRNLGAFNKDETERVKQFFNEILYEKKST